MKQFIKDYSLAIFGVICSLICLFCYFVTGHTQQIEHSIFALILSGHHWYITSLEKMIDKLISKETI